MEWRLSAIGSGRSSWTASELRARGEHKLPNMDSGQNSLEYWDYSVELELLKGPEDLQLAAELGKTLLERNRELESNLKQQQAVIEDQLQEIEYLSKQTAALREVNDSRLRIYEQLEISIQELEKNNQRLSAEGSADKRKIKGLCGNIESLEARCDELQKNLEEARAGAQQLRGRNKRRSIILEEQNFRRSHSCENTTQDEEGEGEKEEVEEEMNGEMMMENKCGCQTSEDRATEELETRAKIEELKERLKESQSERMGEVRRREELEIQLACMAQENAVLQDQLTVLREKEVTLRTFDEELASLDDASSGRLCRKCLGHVDDSASNSGLYDLHDSIEDTDASIESIHGECALVKLKNGGYAWGSQLSQESPASPKSPTEKLSRLTPPRAQSRNSNRCKKEDPQSSCSSFENCESLASIGQVVSHVGSGGTSPGTEVSDAPHNSLLSELDTSYRILIEKYEALLEAREQQQQVTQHAELNRGELIHPGVDDMSGPMSLVMTDGVMNNQPGLKCQRCHTCTCDLKPSVARPKSNMEEFSEVETSSSGFSDGETRISNKATQTGDEFICREIFEDFTPTPTLSSKCLDLSSPINPCDKRFQAAPEYKKLFQEIFSVLKKTVDEKDCHTQPSKTGKTPQSTESTEVVLVEMSNINAPQGNCSEAAKDEPKTSPSENDKRQKVSETDKAESSSENTATELVLSADNLLHSKQTIITAEENNSKSKCFEDSEEQRITHKPPRPDSLDLGGGSSRSSSRQRRRRRHHHRVRLDSLQQQQQFQGQYQYTHGNQIPNPIQGQSSHKSNRRERDHHTYHTTRQGEDFPNLQLLQQEGEYRGTRIVYNSARGKCEHHRSRKHRDRTNNGHSHRHQQLNNHDNEPSNQNDHPRYQGNEAEPKERTTPKMNYPSVEVAKLRKLEMTYAEALKTSFSRSYYNRRY
ncbi:myosin-13-like isoform X2 [Palaemon carinicauda]|uniref:myosin-13-like isoform X2 n=1 Tax=Palaemon carinicauda TaxID=392227 RepID=UPI0035B63F06